MKNIILVPTNLISKFPQQNVFVIWGLPLPIFVCILSTFLWDKKMNIGHIFIYHNEGG